MNIQLMCRYVLPISWKRRIGKHNCMICLVYRTRLAFLMLAYVFFLLWKGQDVENGCLPLPNSQTRKLLTFSPWPYCLRASFSLPPPQKNCRKAGAGVYRCSRVKRPSFIITNIIPKKLFIAPCFIFYIFYVSTSFIFHVCYPKLFVVSYPLFYVNV